MFLKDFSDLANVYSVDHFHKILDRIQSKPANYNAIQQGLAAAIACGAFTFLLGGGIVEMICAFFGAGAGNFVRNKMIGRKLSLFANVGVSNFVVTDIFKCFRGSSGRIYLCNAFCYTGIPADYRRNRYVKA